MRVRDAVTAGTAAVLGLGEGVGHGRGDEEGGEGQEEGGGVHLG